MMNKEEKILEFMEKLDVSREEAEQLWLDDQDDYIGEEGEEMEKKAKTMKPRYEQSGKPVKKNKVRKVDSIKLDILKAVAQAIEEEYGIDVEIEKEVNLHFTLDDENYSIKLTRHRQKKGDK